MKENLQLDTCDEDLRNGFLVSSHGYAVETCRRKEYLHRIIARRMGLQPDEKNKDHDVDHIDGNRLNNCRSNLRLITHAKNTFRGVQHPKRKYDLPRGISFRQDTKRFIAGIKVGQTRIHLGYYSTIENAVAAYKSACIKYFGELPDNFKQ